MAYEERPAPLSGWARESKANFASARSGAFAVARPNAHPLGAVGFHGCPQASVRHEELDVVGKAVGGDFGDGERLLVAPEVDEAEGQFAGNLGGAGMEAHTGRGRGLRVRDEALAALGARNEREGFGHVVTVGACARRVLLAQGVQAEAVGAGRGLDVATVTGVFTHNLEGFEDGQGRAVVTPGEGLVSVGEGGRRHGAYDTAPHTPEVTSSTKHVRISERTLSTSSLPCDTAKTLHCRAESHCRLLNNRSTLTIK